MKRFLLLIIALFVFFPIFAESVADIDTRAQRLYSEKRFSEAIREWLSALEIDPANEKIQQKIEMVYEEKHKKNIALQRSKLQMHETQTTAEDSTVQKVEDGTKAAVDNYFVAYRIDPNDSEIKALRPKMEKFQRDMLDIIEKKRRSEEDKRKYAIAILNAKRLMSEEKYNESVDEWENALDIFENDTVAKEGLRNAQLAISNRVKYERIKALLAKGESLVLIKNYNDAIVEYRQVLLLDAKNDEAESAISKIEDILDGQRSAERKRQQAEQFYQQGIDDLNNHRFNEARDNFESALNLIPKYKDAEFRIQSIIKLRDEYNERMRRSKLAEIEKEFENGLIYFSGGKYKEALSSFERTVVLDPLNTRAVAYLERTKEALRDLQEEEVDSSSPYYDLVSSMAASGKDLYAKERYIESRERWEKIRSLFPNNKMAIEYLLRCDLKLDPERFAGFASGLIEEGKSALEKRDGRKALVYFQMIKSIDPKYPEIDQLIASATAKGKVLKLNTSNAPVTVISQKEADQHYLAGITLYQKGGEANLKAALTHFYVIVQSEPDNTKILIMINKIESQMRNAPGTAVAESVSRLTENQKNMVRDFSVKGMTYYSNNNYDKAIEEWRKVLAIDPGNEKVKGFIKRTVEIMKQ